MGFWQKLNTFLFAVFIRFLKLICDDYVTSEKSYLSEVTCHDGCVEKFGSRER